MKHLVEYINENVDNKKGIEEYPDLYTEIYDILEQVENWLFDVIKEQSPLIEKYLKDTFKTKLNKNKKSLDEYLNK